MASPKARRLSTAVAEPVLKADGITRVFGGVAAARAVNLSVAPGQIVGLIGPNGAGKSTVLNCLSGADRPTSGTVWLNGVDVTNWPDHRRARLGMGRTFQLLRLFPTLSVRDNIVIGLERTVLTWLAGGPNARPDRGDVRARADAALERVALRASSAAAVGTLTAGQRRLVEIARLLAMDLPVLLLDEPAAGLNSAEADELFALIDSFGAEGRAVLLVEHRIRSVVRVVDHLVVMDHGAVIAEGAADQVMALPSVREAYMGPEQDARA